MVPETTSDINLPRETLLDFYDKMVVIRKMEYRLKELFLKGEIVGTLHLSIGQEAVSVGVCANLKKTDFITTTHRGHAQVYAKGADLNRMMAEFFGKATGLDGGKAGDMHVLDFGVGVLAATPIVGGGLPLAVGSALSAKMRGTDQVTVPFFGDGASNQGSFHESLNLASIWKLPVVFVCENNQYAESAKVTEMSAVSPVEKASAYATEGIKVDGMDVLAVYDAAKRAIAKARAGGGPTLVEALTYRYEGHEAGDPFNTYQSSEEIERWKQKDPIVSLGKNLVAWKVVSPDDLRKIEMNADQRVEAAVKFARESPLPSLDEATKGIFVAPYY